MKNLKLVEKIIRIAMIVASIVLTLSMMKAMRLLYFIMKGDGLLD